MNEVLKIEDEFREMLGAISVSELIKNHKLIDVVEKIRQLFLQVKKVARYE